ncbi:hypothetical protein SAMN05216559_1711 [Halomicrobium zhouii]|uniref:Uncharacterized protein n=1 Tax=Halomicrobium zhouii TaxID=767519 RepID=A0A1I6KZZ7_9EURY|nr:hypothetical protein [Halomicrobium zhouii]SFR96799.1 hypothetical protein SAMN05216559_1711 [Halomicrobium zhouii]
MGATVDSADSLTVAGAVSGVLTAVALGYVTLRNGGGVGIAALVATVSGAGAFLFVPYVVRLDRFGQADDDEDRRRVNPGAAGAALGVTGLVVLALLELLGDSLLAAGIGIALGVLEFVIWSLALPRAAQEPKDRPPIHRRG